MSGAGLVNITVERAATDQNQSKWKIELVISDMIGRSTSELATRLGLVLIIWGSRMPGYTETSFLRTLIGDADKLKTVLGFIGCFGENDPFDKQKEI